SVQGSRASAEGRMRGAEALLSYSRIMSPIDGVVTDRPLFEGDLATANQPLLTVMNTSRLIAKAHIAQSEAAVLKVGNPAELKIVQVGVRNAEFTQIVSGVAAGDPVISSGGYGLPDNTQVKIETPAPVEKDSDNKSGKSEKPAVAAKPAAKDKD